MGYTANPFLAGEQSVVAQNSEDEEEDLDSEEREERRKVKRHQEEAAARGFTLVTMEDVQSKRQKVKDTYGTVVHAVTDDEMARLHGEHLLKRKLK